MRNRKVHIAGALVGRVQKCTRCHARIDSNRLWPEKWEPSAWSQGALVSSDGRRNMSVVTEAQAATLRVCGRTA
jgi:hypothetical protein